MSIAIPRPAATVILIRDHGEGGVETYLIRRHQRSGFLGGAHVFPGGKVDDADAAQSLISRIDLPPGPLPDGEGGATFRAAAIRETFEECGVLLSSGPAPAGIAESSGRDLARALAEPDLRLAGDALVHVARWVTPEAEPRRYDTHFYLGILPDGQEASADGVEATEGAWFRPSEAIAAMQRAEIFLAPPTLRNLEILGEAPSAEAALDAARGAPSPVVCPKLVLDEGSVVILLPGDPEFGPADAGPRVPGPTRLRLVDGSWE